MKTLGKVFLGMVCIAFFFACNGADNSIDWTTSSNVTIGWDEPPIPANTVLRYHVYIDTDDDDTHADWILKTVVPIDETSFKLPPIRHKGRYFIGVQSLEYEYNDGKRCGEPKLSRIAWSSNESDTKNGKKFGVKIKRKSKEGSP